MAVGTAYVVVVDGKGVPLPGVTVEATREGDVGSGGGITNAEGACRLRLPAPGTYDVVAIMAGFDPADGTVNVEPSRTSQLQLSMTLVSVPG